MENKVLATIAGVEIKESDLNAIIMRYPEDKRAFLVTDMGKKQLLEQVISFELMNKLGSEMKLDQTEEFKASLLQVQKDLLTQMTISKVLSEVTVTDEEAKNYYDVNTNQFEEAATVSAKHILVDNEELCAEIRTKITNGEMSFEEAAMQYSSCPSKDQGGDLGVFGKGMMVPEFEEAAFASELNEVTAPVATQFGYHLIKVEAKNEPKTSTFEEVKDQIVQTLIQNSQEKKFTDLVKELEAKYEVKRS